MTAIDAAMLEKELAEWVENWVEEDIPGGLSTGTNLFADGLLDSMGLAGLVAYLEDLLETEFDYEEFDPGGEITISAIVAHVLGPVTVGDL